MLKAYEYRIYPNKQQEKQFKQHFGASRWIYNYALAKKMALWTTEKKNLRKFDLYADLPKLKKADETKWLKEVNSQTLQASLEHLDRAYKAFFKTKKGFPKFKSKHNNKQSFTVPQHATMDFENKIITLPKIKPIKVRVSRKFSGKIKTVTVKQTPTNKYFVSVLVETKDLPKAKKKIRDKTTVGLDLGIKDFAVLSTGEKIANPKILSKYSTKLTKTQRRLSRKVKGSSNRKRAKLAVAKIHERITNTRKDFLHKLSHRLTHENQVGTIVVEDLAVKNMVKNHKLAKHISDCSWSEFIRQLEYKSDWYGVNFIKIGRFEPSSKLCSTCGTINHELALNDRQWICNTCGTNHDRDINAAINIKNIGLDKHTYLWDTGNQRLGRAGVPIPLVEPRISCLKARVVHALISHME